MKVGGAAGAGSTGSTGGARAVRAGASAPGFEPALDAAPLDAAQGAAPAGVVAQVSSLEALIALQEVGGPLERKRRAVGRAGAILDALDRVKLDLLEGALDKDAVERLQRAVRDRRALTDDPALEGLLDEIETRAAVELAKLESSALRPDASVTPGALP